jgi:uncharacterized protein (DUF433 family)
VTERPTIGPGDGVELYEELESWEFFPRPEDAEDDNPGVRECDFESLQEVAERLWMSSPFRWRPFDDPFSFLASSSLSGAGDPCFGLGCRLDRARALSRFAALYANTVLIRDPFEDVLHEEDSDKLRLDFAHTLFVLQLLRPAIEAGVVTFAPTDFSLCPDGLKLFRKVEDEVRRRVFEACSALLDEVVRKLDVRVLDKPDYSYLSIGGTDMYVPHPGIDLVPIDREARWQSGRVPTEEEVRDAVQTWVLDPSVIDLQYRHMAETMDGITADPEQCGGRPCVCGMRIRVTDVLDLLAAGLSQAEILEEMPALEKEDIEACLRFASRKLNHPILAA